MRILSATEDVHVYVYSSAFSLFYVYHLCHYLFVISQFLVSCCDFEFQLACCSLTALIFFIFIVCVSVNYDSVLIYFHLSFTKLYLAFAAFGIL